MAVHRPAGPTCALSVNEIDLALRNPNDGPLQAAIVALESGEMDRQSVAELLETEGPPVVAADDRSALSRLVPAIHAAAEWLVVSTWIHQR